MSFVPNYRNDDELFGFLACCVFAAGVLLVVLTVAAGVVAARRAVGSNVNGPAAVAPAK